MQLKLSEDLSLPAEAVTQTFGILAKRGMGKTYTAKVMSEEMLKNKMQVVIIDPIGVWWGLRASADGKSAGLPITIAGGDHADVPISPENGRLLADIIVDGKLSVVVDLSLFRKGEQVRFMTDFAEALYHRNRTAMHLILDEADAFAPQRAMPNEARLLGAIEDIVRRGRARGIGVTMITQRPAVLNKNVLTQIEVLIALRLTAPLDQKAVDEWVKTHAEEGERTKFMESLPSLPVGEAWFWSPGWLNIFQRVKVRTQETLDSSSTPKVGQAITEAKVMAPVDIARLKDALAVTPDDDTNDTARLKEQVKTLKRQLLAARTEIAEMTAEEPQIPNALAVAVNNVIKASRDMTKYADILDEQIQSPSFKKGDSVKVTGLGEGRDGTYRVGLATPKDDGQALTLNPLKKGEIRMLEILSNGYPLGFTTAQMATLAKMKVTGGTFRTYFGNLRRGGYIEETDGQVFATIKGCELIGISPKQMPKNRDEKITMWRQVLRSGEQKLFDLILEHGTLNRYDLAERADINAEGGTFRTYLGNLRRNGIVNINGDTVTIADDLGVGNGKI